MKRKNPMLFLLAFLFCFLPQQSWAETTPQKAKPSPKTNNADKKAKPDPKAKQSAEELKQEMKQLQLTARYMASVHQKIQKLWNTKQIPWVELHRRSAIIQMWIDEKGKLKRIKVTQGSQYQPFDKSLLEAIWKAIPYPTPPTGLVKMLQETGIEILFRRRVLQKKLKPLQLQYKKTIVAPNWKKKKKK